MDIIEKCKIGGFYFDFKLLWNIYKDYILLDFRYILLMLI